jgi:AraC-like DNA-binding protein
LLHEFRFGIEPQANCVADVCDACSAALQLFEWAAFAVREDQIDKRSLHSMVQTPPRMLRFSTGDFPEHSRIEEICEIYGRTIIKVDIEPIEDRPFRFEANFYGVPNLGLASTVIAPCRAPRRTQHIDSDDLVFNVIFSGERLVQQRGREALVVEGEGVLTTSADSGVVTVPSTSRLISMRLPQRRLRAAIGDFDACLLRPIRRDTPALRLLSFYIKTIFSTEALVDPALRDVVAEHVCDLVSLVLGAERGSRQLAEERGLRAARRAAVLHAIEARSSEPGLNAIAIASELGVTPRYVHRLLEESGQTFTHHLLDRRLTRAAVLLRDLRWSGRRIADVALEAGFTDLSYFSRAFRRRYGATASGVREAARRGPVRNE